MQCSWTGIWQIRLEIWPDFRKRTRLTCQTRYNLNIFQVTYNTLCNHIHWVWQWRPQTKTATNIDDDGHKHRWRRPQTMTATSNYHDSHNHIFWKTVWPWIHREFGNFLKVRHYFFMFSLLWSVAVTVYLEAVMVCDHHGTGPYHYN